MDLMIYHCRNYTEIKGDPLFDPNRHARVGVVRWTEDGPDFGEEALPVRGNVVSGVTRNPLSYSKDTLLCL